VLELGTDPAQGVRGRPEHRVVHVQSISHRSPLGSCLARFGSISVSRSGVDQAR
jgi:hypothetical protein